MSQLRVQEKPKLKRKVVESAKAALTYVGRHPLEASLMFVPGGGVIRGALGISREGGFENQMRKLQAGVAVQAYRANQFARTGVARVEVKRPIVLKTYHSPLTSQAIKQVARASNRGTFYQRPLFTPTLVKRQLERKPR